ncbi:MAG: hypothetical protein JXB48_05320 [Candidatus Latescibacteria bacterium]|nr:hypothetical protein [Candidatus Latescibacterota bacterium]
MEEKIKKVRYLLFIALFILLVESIIACGGIFSGFMYKKFDQEKADSMLGYIKENNQVYYEQLTGEDSTYIKEFYSFYEQNGHPLLIGGGFLMLAIAMHTAIPLIIILIMIIKKKEEESEEKSEGGKEGAENAEHEGQDF